MSMMVVNHIVHNISDVSFGKGIQTIANSKFFVIKFCSYLILTLNF